MYNMENQSAIKAKRSTNFNEQSKVPIDLTVSHLKFGTSARLISCNIHVFSEEGDFTILPALLVIRKLKDGR